MVALYFKGMPISKDFYKMIFLHVIPSRVVVQWSEEVFVIKKAKNTVPGTYVLKGA